MSPASIPAYVGCRTTRDRHAAGRGLTTWAVPDDAGAAPAAPWVPTALVAAVNPSYLLLDQPRRLLWALHGDQGECSVYRVADSGHPEHLATVSTGGRNPVHLALPRPDLLLIANYATGTIADLPLHDDGLPSAPPTLLRLPGHAGPHRTQQGSSHPHQILIDPERQVVWVPDKGLDRVFAVALSETGVRIVGELRTPPGSGPRHAVVHPRRPLLYLAEELSSTVSVHRVDGPHLETLARFTTRGVAAARDNTAAGIVLTPDARMLLVSNRGDDTIACFHVDDSGSLSTAGTVPARAAGPRFIALTPDGSQLIVAGELSHELVALDLAPGVLPHTPRVVAETGSPTCVVFADPSRPTSDLMGASS